MKRKDYESDGKMIEKKSQERIKIKERSKLIEGKESSEKRNRRLSVGENNEDDTRDMKR